jgi:hypothetical protein
MKSFFAIFVCGLEASCIFLMDELNININRLGGIDVALPAEGPPFAETQTFNASATSMSTFSQISVPSDNGLNGE